ncbi:MAG TPA: hypothetical protein VFZ09_08220 [Archangium sp.]|uniref:hypothetical protein n=1 Tax=Archangium sp. TaxID=1872627 RepID=UPI002E3453C0|nr:hypothetical protein [Archangium sp.]HEX5746215.1 hypothetical protein [Archangium sp.]
MGNEPFKITQSQLNTFPGKKIQECPSNWVELKYLYPDGTPVSGAKYFVEDAHGSFQTTGNLDANGFARVALPPNVGKVKYWFQDDPDTLDIRVQPKPHGQQAPAGWIDRMGGKLKDFGSWMWGVVQGDFNEDPTIDQIIVGTIITMFPVVDQLADIRDLVAGLKQLLWDKKYDDYFVWVGLVLTLIGLIPVLGSLVKGICKTVLIYAKRLTLQELLKVFNFFAKGNGFKWLKKLRATELSSIGSQVKSKLHGLLDKLQDTLKTLRRYTPDLADDIQAGIANLLDAIKQVKSRVDRMVDQTIHQIEASIDDIMRRYEPVPAMGPARQTHVYKQEMLEPGKSPGSFTGTVGKKPVELPGVKTQKLSYTKRDRAEYEKLRNKFDSTEREKFLKSLANDPDKVEQLKKAGLDSNDIASMKAGKPPEGYRVHHKLSLDDGGDNSFDNLVVIKEVPYHQTITNEQSALFRSLKVGETKVADFPIPDGFIYPPKAH